MWRQKAHNTEINIAMLTHAPCGPVFSFFCITFRRPLGVNLRLKVIDYSLYTYLYFQPNLLFFLVMFPLFTRLESKQATFYFYLSVETKQMLGEMTISQQYQLSDRHVT